MPALFLSSLSQRRTCRARSRRAPAARGAGGNRRRPRRARCCGSAPRVDGQRLVVDDEPVQAPVAAARGRRAPPAAAARTGSAKSPGGRHGDRRCAGRRPASRGRGARRAPRPARRCWRAEHRLRAAGRRSSRSARRCCRLGRLPAIDARSRPTRRPSGRGIRQTRAGHGSPHRAPERRSPAVPARSRNASSASLKAPLLFAAEASELCRRNVADWLRRPGQRLAEQFHVPVLDARQRLAFELQPVAVEGQDAAVRAQATTDARKACCARTCRSARVSSGHSLSSRAGPSVQLPVRFAAFFRQQDEDRRHTLRPAFHRPAELEFGDRARVAGRLQP
jgi:hypothetical protein